MRTGREVPPRGSRRSGSARPMCVQVCSMAAIAGAARQRTQSGASTTSAASARTARPPENGESCEHTDRRAPSCAAGETRGWQGVPTSTTRRSTPPMARSAMTAICSLAWPTAASTRTNSGTELGIQGTRMRLDLARARHARGFRQPVEPIGDRDARRVAEVALRRRDVEPLRVRELRGREACDERLSRETERGVNPLEHATERICEPRGNRRGRRAQRPRPRAGGSPSSRPRSGRRRSRSRRDPETSAHRRAASAASRCASTQLSMYVVSVFDRRSRSGGGAPPARTRDEPRQQMTVARPPDEVGPQGDGRERRCSRRSRRHASRSVRRAPSSAGSAR